ncbi:MAG: UDP-4-amino-4,6-dideoxy-N-acetyl-beta-L-altrosamine transaminase [Deltaproteobacteria bacterium]|nr:UDP-4-amino-4,6-dideoxy-N-acetyl-beta-L-altrosamine transaminase [Deltaproteobacteria bacterium]
MSGEKIIPYGRQWIDENDIAAVTDVLRGDWLTQGPAVERFERALADDCGARHAVAVANGTVALHLACLAADAGPGDEGITSPITFLASANCLVYCGARPVFADIDATTWNIDPAEIEKKITPRTKVVIPVHFAGLPCDMTAIRAIADRHGLMVIEDACHAIGAEYHGRRIGGTGTADMVCFSFHPVKHITTGEGGAVLTNSDELAAKLQMLRHHGVTKDPALMERNDGPWYYEACATGFNARITDFQCALGLSQLGKLDRFLARRREIAERYRAELTDIPGLSFQAVPDDRSHAYHLFVAHFDPTRHNRRKIFEKLQTGGIAPQVHYIPIHQQPAMRRAAGEQGPFANAERYYEGCLSLPMFPALTGDEQAKVICSLRSAIAKGND